jgi:CDP-diacylglycerol---serine O-phosphatidyltransferase
MGMLSFMNAANAVTLVGVAAGVVGIVLSSQGHVPWAALALIVSGYCDGFDGMLARRLTNRTDEQKAFGAHMDTIHDACAFGMAPVALLHAAGMKTPLEVAALVLFSCCAVWRLAYFDTVGLKEEPGGTRSFTGLPTTFTALVIPAALLAGLSGDAKVLRIAANVAAVGMAVAMVSPVRVPKPGGKATAIIGLLVAIVGALHATQHERFPSPIAATLRDLWPW